MPPVALRKGPRYEPLLVLARGGMGTVELVRRREGRFERLYAQKRPHRYLLGDQAARRMFTDEARLAGRVRHPNVVPVLDVGEDDRGPYLVMEYVEGISAARLCAGDPVPIPICLSVAAQAARGLHAAHELASDDGRPLGLVHRDVTPQNLLVGFDGLVRVTDFGIAKAFGNGAETATGVLKGNVGYMAPEALRFEALDRRADLFGLGVVLFELLAGRRLHPAGDDLEAARRILNEPPPDLAEERPETPPDVLALLDRLLAKDRARRPGTALEVARALEAALHDALAGEEGLDLGAFLEARFGEERRLRAEALAAARGRPGPGWTRRRRVALGLALPLALGGLGLAGARLAAPPAVPGLRAVYFSDVQLAQPVHERVDPFVSFEWSDDLPPPGLPPRLFSVRWTGKLLAPATGPTRLCVRSDDGARLWIDGQLVVDEWRTRAAEQTCAMVPLVASRAHDLRLEYFQNLHHAVVELAWETPDRPGRLVQIGSSHLRSR